MRYSLKRKLLHLFFPTRCPICGAYIGAMERFCHECEAKLHTYNGRFEIEGALSFTAAYEYDSEISPAIFLMKNGIDGNASYELGCGLADRLRSENVTADIIVPVPMYRRDTIKRGFNQAALIAKETGRALGIPVELHALSKKRPTYTQKTLGKDERAVNLTGAFSANSAAVKGRNVLLIDDICTTGSTLREITAVLKENGAASVRCACCCKTISHKE